MSTPIDAPTPNTHCRHRHVSAASLLPGDTADDFPTTFHVPSKRSACRRLPAQPTETLPCNAQRKRNRSFTPSSAPEPIVSHTVHGAFSGTNLDIPDDFPTTFHIRRSTRRRLAAQPTAKEGQSLGVGSGSGKSKDPVMSKECLEVRCEDSQRIIKEIEDLKSELDEDLRQLGYCEENEKLRAELAVKVKEVHCLMKRIEELEAKNDLLKKRTEELEAINDGLPKRNEKLQAKNDDLTKQNKELQAENEDLTKQNKELQARNAGLTKGIEEMQAKNDDDLHKNIMEILEIQTDAKRKDLLQFLGLYSIMDFPYPQLKSSDEALLSEGNKIEASSVVAAGSDPKIQIKALISQLLSLTQQVVSADSIQAKDAELANQKEEIKSPKAYPGEESCSNKKDFSQQKIEDGEKLEKVLRATKAILEAISAERLLKRV
ncbi:uncharacterized protein [Miscanthus floridulus]|uniref:uncharacterized protein isoform X2 n=1 Tax=Miscanthus floridulus TaxID=154761 RepID=UPI003459EED5